jgi:uncharacterized protein YbaP (TraB family)
MKRISAAFLLSFLSISAIAQKIKDDNTLLWKISGNGLEKASYLFGTIHMICATDAVLSNNLKKAIRNSDEVYFEIDMDNLFEMVGAMNKMKMLGDTTLKDLLTPEEYEKVKKYFESRESLLPFSMLETFEPILAASTLEQSGMPCDETAMMEQVIMQEAKANDKKIKGLETMSFQAGVLDSIPYKLQAQQLVAYIDSSGSNDASQKLLEAMFDAYRTQDLKKLEELTVESDAAMSAFTDIMLYHRNQNWVQKLKTILPEKSLLIAVGAGHLPGEKGVINLLRKEGYKVTPVDNKVSGVKEI